MANELLFLGSLGGRRILTSSDIDGLPDSDPFRFVSSSVDLAVEVTMRIESDSLLSKTSEGRQDNCLVGKHFEKVCVVLG